ncbi:hypothetical protein CF326_g6716 [Tilletia indica]|nr:hypothetical protein CF326_g6716 [Tilletia indica]
MATTSFPFPITTASRFDFDFDFGIDLGIHDGRVIPVLPSSHPFDIGTDIGTWTFIIIIIPFIVIFRTRIIGIYTSASHGAIACGTASSSAADEDHSSDSLFIIREFVSASRSSATSLYALRRPGSDLAQQVVSHTPR